LRLPTIELRSGAPDAAGEGGSSEVVVVESLHPSVGGVGAALKKQNVDLEVAKAAMSKEIDEGKRGQEVDRKSYRARGPIRAAICSVGLCTLREMVGIYAGVGIPAS
jgi:hypothetical protein